MIVMVLINIIAGVAERLVWSFPLRGKRPRRLSDQGGVKASGELLVGANLSPKNHSSSNTLGSQSDEGLGVLSRKCA